MRTPLALILVAFLFGLSLGLFAFWWETGPTDRAESESPLWTPFSNEPAGRSEISQLDALPAETSTRDREDLAPDPSAADDDCCTRVLELERRLAELEASPAPLASDRRRARQKLEAALRTSGYLFADLYEDFFDVDAAPHLIADDPVRLAESLERAVNLTEVHRSPSREPGERTRSRRLEPGDSNEISYFHHGVSAQHAQDTVIVELELPSSLPTSDPGFRGWPFRMYAELAPNGRLEYINLGRRQKVELWLRRREGRLESGTTGIRHAPSRSQQQLESLASRLEIVAQRLAALDG